MLLGFMVLGFTYEVSSLAVTKPTPIKTELSQDEKMYRGILKMGWYNKFVTPAYAKRLIKEVNEVLSLPDNKWMPPHILLGLAINESDLKWWSISGSKYMPDCGICQNHTPLFARSLKARRILCKQLTKSTKLSFEYAMKELNTIRSKWCSRKKPVKLKKESEKAYSKRVAKWKYGHYKCILNIYNQGPTYARTSCNTMYRGKKLSPSIYKYKVRRCQIIKKYWLRSLCFSKGLELGKRGRTTCRYAYSIDWITRNYK